MKKILIGSASMLVTLSAPLPAIAQAGDDGFGLEEIVVTATKRDSDLQKTAISVQVTSAEQLRKEGKKRIDEIMAGTVGVQVSDGPQGATFYMRGINGTEFFSDISGSSPGLSTVAIAVDGVVQSRSEAVRGGTLDMAQAEVMRGPQTTTVGANALVGAISLVSNQPVFEYQASGSLEVGNYNLLATQGVLNIPLSDNQALRIAYSSNKRDGYAASGAGDSDLSNARLKYRWQINDDMNLVLTAEHQVIGGNGVTQGTVMYYGNWAAYNSTLVACNGGMGVAPTNYPCYDQQAGYPVVYQHVYDPNVTYLTRSNPWNDGYPRDQFPNNPFYHSEINTVSANFDWNLGFGKLTFIPSHQSVHYTTTEALLDITNTIQHFDQRQTQDQFDLRLASTSGGKLEWLGGLFYSENQRSGPVATQAAPGGGMGTSACAATNTTFCYAWTDTKGSSSKSSSAYANVTYSLLDPLRLTGAVRYTIDKKDFTSSVQTTAAVGAAAGPLTPYVYSNSGAGTWSKTTYRGGIEYDVLPNAMAYATYSTGYQAGNVSAAMGGANVGIFPYRCDRSSNATCTMPLFLKQATLGIKSRWFDNKLQANVELFDTRNTNQQQTVTAYVSTVSPYTAFTGAGCTIAATGDPAGTATGGYCITDAGATLQVQSQGVDLDLSYLPTANDRIDVTAEWLHSEYSAATGNPATAAQLTSFGIPSAAAANLLTEFARVAASYNGLPQQNSPARSFNVSYSHAFKFRGGSSLTPKINWVRKSEYWTAGFPTGTRGVTNTQAAFNQYNAYLDFSAADGKFSVSAYGKNLENTPVLLNSGGMGATTVSLDAPRTVGVVFSANF